MAGWAVSEGLPVFALGEGSNIVVSDAGVGGLVIKVGLLGYDIVAEDAQFVSVRVGAGEHWDGVVARAVAEGLSGIEAMSMIPGTTGAAPVQNAGAYGQEIADTLVELEAYDLTAAEFVTLAKADCGFSYRMSAFKGALKGRYIIVGVTLRLSKAAPAEPTYDRLKRYLEEQRITHPTLQQIRDGVMAVRRRILPDPSVVPNSGSFFKNPIVDTAKVTQLREAYPDIPTYEFEGRYKLAAGWLLEQCGFKGAEHFGLQMHTHHALVITNPNDAGFANLERLVELIATTVKAKFDVALEPEPEFVA